MKLFPITASPHFYPDNSAGQGTHGVDSVGVILQVHGTGIITQAIAIKDHHIIVKADCIGGKAAAPIIGGAS